MTNREYLEQYLEKDKLEDGLKRLESGEPVQYIVGNMDFYGFNFDIDSRVLIPRFETEELVEKSLKYIKSYFNKKVSIVDIGTGSGCIAITLKKNLDCIMDAVDISSSALEVAANNAKKLAADISFIEGDLLEPLNKKYDVIISNPPYIAYDDEEVMDIVKNNEPHTALFAPNNGLMCYEKILNNASNYLNDKSMIIFEIGYKQADLITKMVYKNFPNAKVKVEKDMQGRDRFIFIFN